ncbi:hypothetical protein ACH5RR_013758 [Cinchona calisaya]|uniref:Uncharacterized protein n=1 Tax=Cinchona calisaya TaxID=153742 RepID=A0ABD3A387_9GENT
MSTPIPNNVDDDDSDVDIINPFTSLMLPPQQQQPSDKQQLLENKYYKLKSIKSNIVIRQLPSQGLSFQLWPAATTLVTLLDNHGINSPLVPLFKTQENRPLDILELGSGTGLVGIAAAALLGANVTITDLPHVLPNLHFNAEANSEVVGVNGGKVSVAALSWGDVDHMEGVGREFDLILGSDVVYHDHLYEPLIKTLRFFLLGNNTNKEVLVFVMAHLKRWKKESAFFKMARKLFDVQVMHTDSPSNGSRVGVVVYQFVGKAASNVNSVPS